MIPRHRRLLGSLGLLSLASCVPSLAAAAEAAPAVAAADVPAAVRKVIDEHLAGGKAGPVTRATEGGEPVFTTEIARNGESYALSVSPDGKWYSVEIDLSAAPPAVQRKARELAAPGSLDNVAKVLEDGVLVEHWALLDNLGMLKQLGALPA